MTDILYAPDNNVEIVYIRPIYVELAHAPPNDQESSTLSFQLPSINTSNLHSMDNIRYQWLLGEQCCMTVRGQLLWTKSSLVSVGCL